MYNLFEHLPEGGTIWLGDYRTLRACQRATEIRWDIMKQLGYDRATFHCERVGATEHSGGWVYIGGDNSDGDVGDR